MIKDILAYYATQLGEFLQADFYQPEGIVEVGLIGNNHEGKKNKLMLSLFGIERETARDKAFFLFRLTKLYA